MTFITLVLELLGRRSAEPLSSLETNSTMKLVLCQFVKVGASLGEKSSLPVRSLDVRPRNRVENRRNRQKRCSCRRLSDNSSST